MNLFMVTNKFLRKNRFPSWNRFLLVPIPFAKGIYSSHECQNRPRNWNCDSFGIGIGTALFYSASIHSVSRSSLWYARPALEAGLTRRWRARSSTTSATRRPSSRSSAPSDTCARRSGSSPASSPPSTRGENPLRCAYCKMLRHRCDLLALTEIHRKSFPT